MDSAHVLALVEMTFLSLAAHPVILVLAMVLATFLLEDVATVAAGVLASQMVLAPPVALLAVLVGTIVGDLALHLMGRGLAQTSWGRALRSRPEVAAAESWLTVRSMIALATARFVPGLRLPIYAASGFIRTPFRRVGAVVVGVSLIWTPAIFWLSATAGAAGSKLPLGWAATLLVAALTLIALAPRITRRGVAN